MDDQAAETGDPLKDSSDGVSLAVEEIDQRLEERLSPVFIVLAYVNPQQHLFV